MTYMDFSAVYFILKINLKNNNILNPKNDFSLEIEFFIIYEKINLTFL